MGLTGFLGEVYRHISLSLENVFQGWTIFYVFEEWTKESVAFMLDLLYNLKYLLNVSVRG